MLITRPCLCRIDRRIQKESAISTEFNTTSANLCINAALEMAKLFPAQPDLSFAYYEAPWWAIVHLRKSQVGLAVHIISNKGFSCSSNSCTLTGDGLREQGD
jgi:hypothetical protein